MSIGRDLFDLGSKVGIVTGSGRGLGKTIAKALARANMNVVVTDIDAAGITATCDEITAAGGAAFPLKVDVNCEEDVINMVKRVVERYGRIDVLVNNAGVGSRTPLTEMTLEEWDRIIGINLTGTFLCSREVVKVMMKQKSGKIINLSSIWGQLGGGGVGYAASKGGINQFTKTLALQLADWGINVNAIAPMYMRTDMVQFLENDQPRYQYILNHTPLHRLGEPDELEGAVLLLASDASNYITGHILNVDGGFTVG